MVSGAEPLVRKTVTVLFCDVVGSTTLSERVDAETNRRVILRYFDEARSVLERHGGTVEKFIGDAVMAVFGVPVVHEDDALRAVLAADELRLCLLRLNEELDQRWGVSLEWRIGINTGEVVVGDPTGTETIGSGDTFNVAARLQQAANPGEVLLGRETYRLVRDRVAAGPLRSFPLKGKSERISPWQLEHVKERASGMLRRLDSPFVGRERERALLDEMYARVVAAENCRLLTVVGTAGIGKSRLAQEFAARLLAAAVLQGRCLPYGDGITFWPMMEIVRDAAGISAGDSADVARSKVARLVESAADADLVCDRVCSTIGLSDREARPEESFWALRRLFEAMARAQPLVLVFEDIHWAEPTMLDLLEYLVGWSGGTPIMILCLARPEFFENRPTWVGETVGLDRLDSDEIETLAASAVGPGPLDPAVATRIATVADGNPLFAEELARMLVDDGVLTNRDGVWTAASDLRELPMPPSIQALLAARLDRLEPAEKEVLQCASVVGREFWSGSVADLASDDVRSDVATHLHALVRKRLIVPGGSAPIAGEDAFRFAHVLVRDAAYAGLPKYRRSDLHERHAERVLRTIGERAPEVEEIVGYHLEQAYKARADLGPLDDKTNEFAARAARFLASAGHRALARGDLAAAPRLLRRACALPTPEDAARAELRTDLGVARLEAGELADADAAFRDALEIADRIDDPRVRARVQIERSVLGAMDASAGADELLATAHEAIDIFEKANDEYGLSRAWSHAAYVSWWQSRYGEMETLLERARVHAERSGDGRTLTWILGSLARVALVGPRPVPDAVERVRAIRAEARDDLVVAATADTMLAVLEAMNGRIDVARGLYLTAQRALSDLGLSVQRASFEMYAGWAELIAGDPTTAERELRTGFDSLASMGERSFFSTTAAFLARALVLQERVEEAYDVTQVSEEAATKDDLVTQVMWRGVRARVLVRRGEGTEAETLARDGVTLGQKADFANMQATAACDLADVLVHLGRPDEARDALEDALALYESKGNRVSAAQTCAAIEELTAARIP